MFFQNNNANNTQQMFQFFNQLSRMSDKDLNMFVEQARKLGISENNISQGMSTINSLRGMFNNTNNGGSQQTIR